MTDLIPTDPTKPGPWEKNGPSPNPTGRPPGIVDKRQNLQKAFADDAPKIARVVIDKALEGDMQAANIVLARRAAPLKAQAERVEFELSPHVPLSEQANQILVAVSEGKLDAETGKTLIGCIQSVAGIRAVEELEHRINGGPNGFAHRRHPYYYRRIPQPLRSDSAMPTNNNRDYANRPVKHRLTNEEKQRILELHEEQARDRQLASDLNLLRAKQLSEALRALKGH